MARGGAVFSLLAASASAAIVAGEDTLVRSDLQTAYGVMLSLSGDRNGADLIFGPLGLGRVASQTIRLRKGRAEAKLIVSSFGRVVRE